MRSHINEIQHSSSINFNKIRTSSKCLKHPQMLNKGGKKKNNKMRLMSFTTKFNEFDQKSPYIFH